MVRAFGILLLVLGIGTEAHSAKSAPASKEYVCTNIDDNPDWKITVNLNTKLATFTDYVGTLTATQSDFRVFRKKVVRAKRVHYIYTFSAKIDNSESDESFVIVFDKADRLAKIAFKSAGETVTTLRAKDKCKLETITPSEQF